MMTSFLRRIPRRFSLRTLFLATAVCAAALGWWRWPIQIEAVVEPTMVHGWDTYAHWFNQQHREVRTVRRSLNGDLVQDGITTGYVVANPKLYEQHWENGVLHGPYREWMPDGKLGAQGQYAAGKRAGTWSSYSEHYLRRWWPCRHEGWCGMSPRIPVMSDVYVLFSSAQRVDWMFDEDRLVSAERRCSSEELRGEIETVTWHNDNSATLTCWTQDKNLKLEETAYFESDRTSYRRHGNARGWHDNGAQCYSGQWYRGRPCGEWKYYDREGSLALEIDCVTMKTLLPSELGIHDVICGIIIRQANTPEFRVAVDARYLASPLRATVNAKSFDELVSAVNAVSRMAIKIDNNQLTASRIARQLNVALITRGFPADLALSIALKPHGLACGVKRDHHYVTTEDRAQAWFQAGGWPDEPTSDLDPFGDEPPK